VHIAHDKSFLTITLFLNSYVASVAGCYMFQGCRVHSSEWTSCKLSALIVRCMGIKAITNFLSQQEI